VSAFGRSHRLRAGGRAPPVAPHSNVEPTRSVEVDGRCRGVSGDRVRLIPPRNVIEQEVTETTENQGIAQRWWYSRISPAG